MRWVSLTLLILFGASCSSVVIGQTATEKMIAARYAPVFHQALGSDPRADYITNFDFDGDWNGTNNWANTENPAYKLRGYVYYSLSETTTHYFIHYAVFHPRDYKGGDTKGVFYSDLLRAGARIISKGEEPTGKLAMAAIAHENDMEGALVVVEKSSAKIAFVETLHHNLFSRYVPGSSSASTDGIFRASGDHVELYVEPKGHGIEAWGTERERPEKGFLTYSYSGKADDPEASTTEAVGYDLLPIASTLWPKARIKTKNTTFASFKDFGTVTIGLVQGAVTISKKIVLGSIASAFDGKVGGVNQAKPPWGWFSTDRSEDPPGLWFFDPATVVKRDYSLPATFSTAYTKVPFWAGK